MNGRGRSPETMSCSLRGDPPQDRVELDKEGTAGQADLLEVLPTFDQRRRDAAPRARACRGGRGRGMDPRQGESRCGLTKKKDTLYVPRGHANRLPAAKVVTSSTGRNKNGGARCEVQPGKKTDRSCGTRCGTTPTRPIKTKRFHHRERKKGEGLREFSDCFPRASLKNEKKETERKRRPVAKKTTKKTR